MSKEKLEVEVGNDTDNNAKKSEANGHSQRGGVKQETVDLSAKIATGIKINAKGETTVAEDVYEKSLPEGLDIKTVQAVHAHDGRFIAAATHAVGTQAVETFKKHKGVEVVHVAIPMAGKNCVEIDVEREHQYPGMNGGQPVTKYGVVNTKYEYHEAGNRGQLKAVKTMINQQALEAFGK